MLDKWLNYQERVPSPYTTFRIIDVSEKVVPDDEIKDYLASQLSDSYRNIDFMKLHFENELPAKLTEYIESYLFPADTGIADKIVKPGDFGEILAALIVSYFEGLTVPIKKLRWKFNKDRAVFCTDMIAHNSDQSITDIHYYEIKTRQGIRKEKGFYVTVNAHNSLVKDQTQANQGIADFLSRLSFEEGDLDASIKYADIVKNPANYNSHFELFFIIESTKFISDILDDLHALPPSLAPLNVTVVLLTDFRVRVDESYASAMTIFHDHVYGK